MADLAVCLVPTQDAVAESLSERRAISQIRSTWVWRNDKVVACSWALPDAHIHA
jgi:hypothetical protein